MEFPAHASSTKDIEDIVEKWKRDIPDHKRLIINDIIHELVLNITSNLDTNRKFLNTLIARHGRGSFAKADLNFQYRELVTSGKLNLDKNVLNTLTKKVGRSDSGVVSITVSTSPGKFSCPQNCHYCPNEPGMPRSYVSTGPSILRAARVDFDVVRQFKDRALCLASMGHEITKIEIIVLGGTWSYHLVDYQEQFISGIYYAANTLIDEVNRPIKTLEEEIKINETATARIIGLTLETRPDHINEAEITRFRKYGVTRVQLGVQHLDDKILEYINRRCPTYRTYDAIRLLKENGFKTDLHFMPDLPGSSYEQDLEMFQTLFSKDNELIQGDQLKIYPCMTTQHTEILKWYKDGSYKPYHDMDDGKLLFDLIVYITTHVPRWIRLNRVVRDIPSTVIEAGIKETNLYQRVLKHMSDHSLKGNDIRFREIKLMEVNSKDCAIFIDTYRSSGGLEYFISYETKDREKLIGFLRLRINDNPEAPYFKELKGATLVRELHVYGKLVHQNRRFSLSHQHQGIGKMLLAKAEDISKNMHKYTKIAIISGIGVREYYRKRGYVLEGSYMTKNIKSSYMILRHKPWIIAATGLISMIIAGRYIHNRFIKK